MRQLGHDVHGMAFDLEDLASIDALHDEMLSRFGRLDVLVNSACPARATRALLTSRRPKHGSMQLKGTLPACFVTVSGRWPP